MYIYISRPLCAGAARDQLERGQGHDPVGQAILQEHLHRPRETAHHGRVSR